jgi:transcriptional regulator with XRE-family HTH domain
MKALKLRLKAARTDRHWSQAELAKRLNVHVMTVSRWERGVEIPSLRTLDRLARVLGVRMEDLIR